MEMERTVLLIRSKTNGGKVLNEFSDALRRMEGTLEIDLDCLGDDAEAWDGVLTQILESELCVCI